MPDLAEAIRAMVVSPMYDGPYLMTEEGEKLASAQSFGQWMRKAYDAAGLPMLANHGLRKLTAIRLAYAG